MSRLADAQGPALAIASSGAEADHTFVHVVEREIDDLSGSITRFLIVARPGVFGELSDGSDPTLRSIVLAPRWRPSPIWWVAAPASTSCSPT